jgi:hypothetical protein
VRDFITLFLLLLVKKPTHACNAIMQKTLTIATKTLTIAPGGVCAEQPLGLP